MIHYQVVESPVESAMKMLVDEWSSIPMSDILSAGPGQSDMGALLDATPAQNDVTGLADDVTLASAESLLLNTEGLFDLPTSPPAGSQGSLSSYQTPIAPLINVLGNSNVLNQPIVSSMPGLEPGCKANTDSRSRSRIAGKCPKTRQPRGKKSLSPAGRGSAQGISPARPGKRILPPRDSKNIANGTYVVNSKNMANAAKNVDNLMPNKKRRLNTNS